MVRAVTDAAERERLAAVGEYETVDTFEALDRWIEIVRQAKTFAFDCETTAINALDAEPVGFSVSTEPGNGCYIVLHGPDGPVLDEDEVRRRLRPILTDAKLHLVGQNLKYDWVVLQRWGIEITNIAFDTMIAAWLVDTTAGSYNMDRLAEEYLGYKTIHYADLFSGDRSGDGNEAAGTESSGTEAPRRAGRAKKVTDRSFTEVDLTTATRYAAEDADITLRLQRSCWTD